MSSKLDQSLEEITGGRRNNARGPRRGGKPRVSTGGINKNSAPTKPTRGQPRPAKAAAVAAAVPALPTSGDSKIVVSNLSFDITEAMLKEYFTKEVGHIKKVTLNYNKTGRSLGVATIIFSQAQSAAKAAKNINGVPVDGKPMKVEVVLGAQFAPDPVAPKPLHERIQKPKKEANKPKSAAAAAPKPANAPAGGAAGAKGRGGKKVRANRPKPKTVEELDAEMSEYFDPNAVASAPAANTNGAAAPVAAAPAGGDANMEDEIM